MPAKMLDGRELARELIQQLKEEVAGLKSRTGAVPRLVNILVGLDAGSCAYAKSQQRTAEKIGVEYDLVNLKEDTTQDELIEYIERLNHDPDVHGLMVHKPLPGHIDARTIANTVAISKDLEGVNVVNIGKMLLGETDLIPCTPAAVMEMVKLAGMDVRGRETVIVGASEIVGKPLGLLMLREMATVTVCHIATSEAGMLEEHVRNAELLVVAVGKPEVVKGRWIRDGAVVIDVGINRKGDGLVGDVEFAPAAERAGFITPVPGGVGPVTVVMLMRNGLRAFQHQLQEAKKI